MNVNDGADYTFIFTPNEGCQLEQVSIDGLDVTPFVINNKLTTTVHENSNIIVTFSKLNADVNGDGYVNINDVVTNMNIILGL